MTAAFDDTGRSTSAPQISVVMTVINPHPIYFPVAVESILRQQFTDFELIIVEDPSPARAADILCQFHDPRVRHIRNPVRTSLVHQKNLGLVAARADLIAMFDADDVAEPHRLGSQLQYMRLHHDIDVLGSQIILIDNAGSVLGSRRFPLNHDAIVAAMHKTVPISHPSVMIRRSALAKVGGYQCQPEITTAEDYDLWSLLAHNGARFANHSAKLIRYRLHSEQIKYTRLRDSIRAALFVKRKYWMQHMGLTSRLRMCGERAMLLLPRTVVFWIFAIMNYHFFDRSP